MNVRFLSETATTVTFGWDPVAKARGFRYTRPDGVKSHTWNGATVQAKFQKMPGVYLIEPLLIQQIGEGAYPVVVSAPAAGAKGLYGFVRHVSHVDAGRENGQALAAVNVTDKRVVLQFEDPTSDAANVKAIQTWATQWRWNNVEVDGWWRVNQRSANSPPDVPLVTRWWPNAEDPGEISRLDAIYTAGSSMIEGMVTLGKVPPPVVLPTGKPVGLECFRENAQSDTNVSNSVTFWVAQGVPVSRIVVLLQGYGTPFAPAVDEAKVALSLGVRKLAFYPLDGFTPAEISGVGNLLAAAV